MTTARADTPGNAHPALGPSYTVQYRHDPAEIGRAALRSRAVQANIGGSTNGHRSSTASRQVSSVRTEQIRDPADLGSTFRALADDKSGALPYDADLADQRARYGDGLLRRAPEQVSRQEAYESEAQARVEEARKLRAAEQERIRAAEVSPLLPKI